MSAMGEWEVRRGRRSEGESPRAARTSAVPRAGSSGPLQGKRHELVRFDLEGHRHQVEVVADGVQPGDLDDLPLAEVLAQVLKGGVADLPVPRHLLRVGKDRALALREAEAGPVVEKPLELLEIELLLDGLGPVKISAEGAAVDERGLGGEESRCGATA